MVERFRLIAFKTHLNVLDLSSNEISHLDANVFDDLKNLKKLFLNENNLKEVPEDIFKELTNLEVLFLGNNMFKEVPVNLFKELSNLRDISLIENQLTILPRHLFRNNKNLLYVDLANNKINRIEFDFNDLPNLEIVGLKGNVCINEGCVKPYECQSFDEMFDRIKRNCTN